MAGRLISLDDFTPGEIQLPGLGGDEADYTPELDDGTDITPGWGGHSDPRDAAESVAVAAHGPDEEAWWHRLSLALTALAVMLGSAFLPPSRPARAETTLGQPIQVGPYPAGVDANPVTNRVYVTQSETKSVTVVDVNTLAAIGSPIPVGTKPISIAVNATTNRIYVSNYEDSTVSIIDGASNTILGAPVPVGEHPWGIAVNPKTNRVYVANSGSTSNSVSVIDGATSTVVGPPISVGNDPMGVTVNPTTNRVYVANGGGGVSAIDGATNTVIGSPIAVGASPLGIAVNPVTNRVYVTDFSDSTVTVIDGAANAVVGTPIKVGKGAFGVGINQITNRVYVTNYQDSTVSVIDGAGGSALGHAITVGAFPAGVAAIPSSNQIFVSSFNDKSVSVVGIPLSVGPGTAASGDTVTATWSSLFGPHGGDFVGLYDPAAPNASPLSRIFTNGTASAGGNGLEAGSVSLPIPVNLPTGSYQVRLVSGASGAILALVAAGAPAAAADSYTVPAATTLNVPAPGVLANDTAGDASPLQATLATNPAHGSLSLLPSGAFSYTPNVSFSGTDSFTYRITSQAGLPATATVTVTVTAAPLGTNDTYTVVAGGVLSVPAPGVLANDTDPDSSSLQASIASNPAHGTLGLQPDGAFTYTPGAGFSGTDTFAYRATDQTSLSAPARVTITVTPASSGPGNSGGGTPGPGSTTPPIAANDSYSVAAQTTLTVEAPGLLANDTDPDSPLLSASVVNGPAHGTLSLSPNGAFAYAPRADFFGTDTFTYRSSDGSNQSAVATVTLTVTATECSPRPRVKAAPAPDGVKLLVRVEPTPLNTQQPNPLKQVRFGTFQNAKVTLNDQPIASGQAVTPPANASALDFTVERVTPGQATTVPFTVVDGCGEWPTLVGGGTNAGF